MEQFLENGNYQGEIFVYCAAFSIGSLIVKFLFAFIKDMMKRN